MEEVSALCCASHGSLSPGVCPVCLHDRLTHLGASLSRHPEPSKTPDHTDTIIRVGSMGTISTLIHMDTKTTTTTNNNNHLNLPPRPSSIPVGGANVPLGRSKSVAIQTTKTRRKTLETKSEPTIRELSAQAMAEKLSTPPPFAKSKSTGSNLVVPSSTKSSPGSLFPRFKTSPSAFFRRLRQSPPAPVNPALAEERVDTHSDEVEQADYESSCFSARSSKMSTPTKDSYPSTNTNTISSRTSCSYGHEDSELSINGSSSTRTSNDSKNMGSSSFSSWEGVLASSVRRLMMAMFVAKKPSRERRRRKMQQAEEERSVNLKVKDNFCGSSSVSCFMDSPFAPGNSVKVH